MKKCKTLILIINFIIIISFFIIYNKKENYIDDNYYVQKSDSLLSMNLEQNVGAGDYKTVTQSKWPTEGYVFNSELSRCENGPTLSWDDTNKAVTKTGYMSDKCYVYFDIYNPSSLVEYIISLYAETQGNNGIYYHNNNLENGAGDNSYRYAGANPSNYVCFGSDASPCPEDNLFRIIGMFENKIKLIKAILESELYWNTLHSNTWSSSSLNTYLNGEYLTSLGLLADKIALTTWKVGENTTENLSRVIPSTAYQNEIVNPIPGSTSITGETEHNAKIGLMYASDYYYGASPSAWTKMGYNYKTNTNVNWIYSGETEWLISPISDYNDSALSIYDDGNVSYSTDYYKVYTLLKYRPSFYLNSDITYIGGTGTQSDPFIIN